MTSEGGRDQAVQSKTLPHLLCIGHRGAMGYEPENTLASIAKAVALGAPCVEVDVYLVEGRLVVFHDDRLERTTNGSGFLQDHTFEYLRSLDAGNGQKIPTLVEICDAVNPHTCLNIELKGPATAEPVVDHIEKLIGQGWSYDALLISSFEPAALLSVASLNPNILLGFILTDAKAIARCEKEEWPVFSIHLPAEMVTATLVTAAHKMAAKVFAFTVNKLSDIERMHRLGVDGVFTNYPDRVLENYSQGAPGRSWETRSALP